MLPLNSFSFHFMVLVQITQVQTLMYLVEHVSADVVNFEESEKGIESLELDNGSTSADLFVDCGFSSLLLGKWW